MLSLVMEKVQAWELLNDYEYMGRVNVEGLQVLMQRAGYLPDVVQRAVNRHGNARLDAGLTL